MVYYIICKFVTPNFTFIFLTAFGNEIDASMLPNDLMGLERNDITKELLSANANDDLPWWLFNILLFIYYYVHPIELILLVVLLNIQSF